MNYLILWHANPQITCERTIEAEESVDNDYQVLDQSSECQAHILFMQYTFKERFTTNISSLYILLYI